MKKQYFGIRFLQENKDGIMGFNCCIDFKLMIEKNQLGVMYHKINRDDTGVVTMHVLIEFTGFKWIQTNIHPSGNSSQNVIHVDSWKIIKKVEL